MELALIMFLCETVFMSFHTIILLFCFDLNYANDLHALFVKLQHFFYPKSRQNDPPGVTFFS